MTSIKYLCFIIRVLYIWINVFLFIMFKKICIEEYFGQLIYQQTQMRLFYSWFHSSYFDQPFSISEHSVVADHSVRNTIIEKVKSRDKYISLDINCSWNIREHVPGVSYILVSGHNNNTNRVFKTISVDAHRRARGDKTD